MHGGLFLDGHGDAGGDCRFEGYLTSLDDSSALLPICFCATPPGRYLVSCTATPIAEACLVLWPQLEHNGAHTCLVFGTLTEPRGPFR